MFIKIRTNLPCLIITIWDGYGKQVAESKGTSKPIAYFSSNNTAGHSEVEEVISSTNLPKGLYQVRISLPYHNGIGPLYPMPTVMDKTVMLEEEDVTITFKTTITEE